MYINIQHNSAEYQLVIKQDCKIYTNIKIYIETLAY